MSKITAGEVIIKYAVGRSYATIEELCDADLRATNSRISTVADHFTVQDLNKKIWGSYNEQWI